VVGQLPWHGLAKGVDWSDRRARQGVYERASEMKEQLLTSGFDALGKRWAHCPPQLEAYFRRVRIEVQRGGPEVPAGVYNELAQLLQNRGASEHWTDVAVGKPRTFYEAERGRLLWRPPQSGGLAHAETLEAEPGLRVASTGRAERCDGGLWAELDPVWLQGVPREVWSMGGWILVADWGGRHLLEVAPSGEYLPQGHTAASVGPLEPTKPGQEERELRAAAAQAARYARGS